MGIDRNFYVGPYIRYTKKKVEFEQTLKGCLNKSCPAHKRAAAWDTPPKFCPECGGATGSFQAKGKKDITLYDLFEQEEDVFSTATDSEYKGAYEFLIPNHRRKPPREFRIEMSTRIDLTDFDPKDEMVWLEEAFAKELEKLRATFDKVEIRWGVITYYS